MDKKGFLFTVTVFLVLTYILLSVSVWVKGVETSERAYAEFYKESTVELAIEQITPAKMDNVTYVIMNRALYRLNEHSIDHPVKEGPEDDEFEKLRAAMYELLMEGSANESYFTGDEGLGKEANSSLNTWVQNLNASLLAIGVYISEFEVPEDSFKIGQSAKGQVNYSFDINLKMRDLSNTSAVSRTYTIPTEPGIALDITGLVDPALARESKEEAGDELTIYRMFFFHDDYDDTSSISISKEVSIKGGQGWLYAPLALADGTAEHVDEYSNIAPSERRHYILVGDFDEITEASNHEMFSGYIVTSEPTIEDDYCDDDPIEIESDTFNPIEYTEDPDCVTYLGNPPTSHPFVIAPNFDIDDAPVCPMLDGSGQMRKCVLILAKYLPGQVADTPSRKNKVSGAGIFNVEGFRDFVMCGFYAHNPDAPSYLQHLLEDPYSRSDSDYGIETFVVGNYANSSVYDDISRLDRELFDGADGIKIRGMPGCKDFSMCSDEPITGIFAVSGDAKEAYGLDNIACDNEAAGCD